MRHQSADVESPLARESTHSTYQPRGIAQDQAKPANISSNALLGNKATSKADYTNTQQGLPVNRIYLLHLSRHARLFGLRGLFCRKSN